MSDDNLDNIDISSLMRSYNDNAKRSLKSLYEYKLSELNINQTQALETMQIQSRALSALLSGSSSRVDLLSLVKLSKFLDITQSEAANLYLSSLNQSGDTSMNDLEKRKFILKNFDLTELKKEGILNNTTDFEYIEDTIVKMFNYKTIFDYRRDVISPAYSAAKLHNKSLMSDYWIEFAREAFRKINNTNIYDSQALIEYFPKIRWHSMDEKKGLWEVIRALYKMGITVMYLPKFKKLHIRGATFSVNKKPCIVLTDYKGYYPTLWFSLLHELHHVIFDWDEILVNSFHISDNTGLYNQSEVEQDANKFARDYLFSAEKSEEILPHLNNFTYVKNFAKENQVHYSIPYAFAAFDNNQWAWAGKFMPPMDECLGKAKSITFKMSASEVGEFNTNYIYN